MLACLVRIVKFSWIISWSVFLNLVPFSPSPSVAPINCRFVYSHSPRFLEGFFPSFSTLNILTHSLLAYKISAEKSAVSLIGILLYITWRFALAVHRIFSLSLTFDSFTVMCFREDLFGLNLFGDLCAFLYLDVCFLQDLGHFQLLFS